MRCVLCALCARISFVWSVVVFVVFVVCGVCAVRCVLGCAVRYVLCEGYCAAAVHVLMWYYLLCGVLCALCCVSCFALSAVWAVGCGL